jgi:NADH:ubiquinone oxidoreductase subunit H
MTLFCICVMTNTFNITHIYYANSQYPLIILLPLYITVIMAETNRTPFDLPESESETIAGYFVEYSAIPFALYFLAEYTSMLFMSVFSAILFFSNLTISLFFIYLFVWIRASFPRLRYDQVLKLGWKILIPISLAFCSIVPALVIPFTL